MWSPQKGASCELWESNFESKCTSKKHHTPEGRQHRERQDTTSTTEHMPRGTELRTQSNQCVENTIDILSEKREDFTIVKQTTMK